MEKSVTVILAIGLAISLGYIVYQYGYTKGAEDIQSKWAEDRAATEAANLRLSIECAKQEENHRITQEGITNELAKARKEHEAVLSNQRIDFEHRLLQSARRAEVYQHQADSDASERRDLANHAARLDRALEEGRGLVLELSATLGLRERQLKQLGDQIRNDRQLFADK